MKNSNGSRLEPIVREIEHVARHAGDHLTIDTAILELADYIHRRENLTHADRSVLMQAAALLWRAGFNASLEAAFEDGRAMRWRHAH